MEKLHLELKLDIFSRLPAESILECKLVCKPWLRLLKNDPMFPQMHLRRRLLTLQQLHDNDVGLHNYQEYLSQQSQSQTSGGFEVGFMYLKFLDGNKKICQLWYGKFDDDEHSFKAVRRINLPNFMTGQRYHTWERFNAFIGSCNGLICCSIPHNKIQDPIYILNPITREFVNLPKFIIRDEIYSSEYHTMLGGFGYSPTNEYKVVRIFCPDYYEKNPPGQVVQVYTLGDGNGWRNKGVITYSFFYEQPAVFVNGEIHWLVNNYKLQIVAFDLALEEFYFLPSPPVDGGCHRRRLSVMGRWLCLSDYVSIRGGSDHVDMWLLKKKTSSTSYDDMNEQVEYHRGGWIKVFTITTNYPIDPLGLTNIGEVLFMKSKSLCIYDLKTATLEKLEELDDNYCGDTAIPHINSLISLKSLGEKCRRRNKNYV